MWPWGCRSSNPSTPRFASGSRHRLDRMPYWLTCWFARRKSYAYAGAWRASASCTALFTHSQFHRCQVAHWGSILLQSAILAPAGNSCLDCVRHDDGIFLFESIKLLRTLTRPLKLQIHHSDRDQSPVSYFLSPYMIADLIVTSLKRWHLYCRFLRTRVWLLRVLDVKAARFKIDGLGYNKH